MEESSTARADTSFYREVLAMIFRGLILRQAQDDGLLF
jgi:hypothetical protein